MHLFHIPQCSIQNRNVYISVLNGALWGMEQVHSGIYEIGLLCFICLLTWDSGIISVHAHASWFRTVTRQLTCISWMFLDNLHYVTRKRYNQISRQSFILFCIYFYLFVFYESITRICNYSSRNFKFQMVGICGQLWVRVIRIKTKIFCFNFT